MKNALVSGGSGFIGRKLISKLTEEGVRVTAIIHDEDLRRRFEGLNATVVFCPLNVDPPEVLESGGYDVFYHLAWDGVSSSSKNDYEKQLKNVEMSLNACRLADRLQCGKMIFPGSVSQFSYSDEPVDGTQVPSPADAYGVAKVAAQLACNLFCRQHGIDFVWLLIPSIYGPGRHDNNVITYTIESLLKGVRPSYTKLEQKWDYLYIDDLIEAIFLAGDCAIDGLVYAIGSGDQRPLAAFVRIVRDLINPDAELGIGDIPYKNGRVDNSIVDVSRFCDDTGFKARTSFDEGILKTVEYYRGLI